MRVPDPVRLVAVRLRELWGETDPQAVSDRDLRWAHDLLAAALDGAQEPWRLVRTEAVEAVVDGSPEWLSVVTEDWLA